MLLTIDPSRLFQECEDSTADVARWERVGVSRLRWQKNDAYQQKSAPSDLSMIAAIRNTIHERSGWLLEDVLFFTLLTSFSLAWICGGIDFFAMRM